MIRLLKIRSYTGDVLAPSPNHGARRSRAIEGIVLHATADEGNEEGSITWMRSPRSRVSCHLLVSRTGRVTRLVGDQQRAWHAGASWWRGTSDVNSITLGIEIANRNDGEPFAATQYRRVAEIVAHYCRQGLTVDDVVGHDEIAPERRSDPLGWDWDRFRRMVEDRLWPGDLFPAAPRLPALPKAPPDSGSGSAANITAAARWTPSAAIQRVQELVRPKHILYSRTVWVNGLTVLAALGVLVGDTLDLASRVGIDVPAEVTMWALFGVGVVNIILRLGTTQPLTCNPALGGSCSDTSTDTSTDPPESCPSIVGEQRLQRSSAAGRAVPSRGALPPYERRASAPASTRVVVAHGQARAVAGGAAWRVRSQA